MAMTARKRRRRRSRRNQENLPRTKLSQHPHPPRPKHHQQHHQAPPSPQCQQQQLHQPQRRPRRTKGTNPPQPPNKSLHLSLHHKVRPKQRRKGRHGSTRQKRKSIKQEKPRRTSCLLKAFCAVATLPSSAVPRPICLEPCPTGPAYLLYLSLSCTIAEEEPKSCRRVAALLPLPSPASRLPPAAPAVLQSYLVCLDPVRPACLKAMPAYTQPMSLDLLSVAHPWVLMPNILHIYMIIST